MGTCRMPWVDFDENNYPPILSKSSPPSTISTRTINRKLEINIDIDIKMSKQSIKQTWPFIYNILLLIEYLFFTVGDQTVHDRPHEVQLTGHLRHALGGPGHGINLEHGVCIKAVP